MICGISINEKNKIDEIHIGMQHDKYQNVNKKLLFLYATRESLKKYKIIEKNKGITSEITTCVKYKFTLFIIIVPTFQNYSFDCG